MPLPLLGSGAVTHLVEVDPLAPDAPLDPELAPVLPPVEVIGLMVFPDEAAALHAATMAIAEATQTKR
jgi:hypothetical protein